jgi:flagellar assembly protein FliH
MSSKLLRGAGIPTEPVAWQRVSPLDTVAGVGEPATMSYLAAQGSSLSTREPGDDVEQRIHLAHQQGYDEGQVAGREPLAAQLEVMQGKLARTIEEITGLRQRYRRQAEQDVVSLALEVARRILHRELTVSPDALLGLVKAALDKMDAREVHQVRVAPQDAPLVREFFDKMGLPRRIEVLADPGLSPGSAILESSRGALDASVDTQLIEIERGFADLARGAQ